MSSANTDLPDRHKTLIAKLEALRAEALADRFEAMVVFLDVAIARLREKGGTELRETARSDD